MPDIGINNAFDIANRYTTTTTDFDPTINRGELQEQLEKEQKDKSTLSFTDMLGLMVAQFQYQTIDNQADTSDMMNQLVQMSSMQAMTEMTTQIKELTLANVMAYSASLVGQYVTVGVYDESGKIVEEIYDKVEAAGTYSGQQVIFLRGKSYLLSNIMAVGRLPARVDEVVPDGEEPGKGDVSDKVEQTPDTETKDDGSDEKDSGVSGADTDNQVD